MRKRQGQVGSRRDIARVSSLHFRSKAGFLAGDRLIEQMYAVVHALSLR
jgi:hypothetical protein